MGIGRELTELLDDFHKVHPTFTIVETGCARSKHPGAEESDGWSTLFIAKWLQDNIVVPFYSIEIDPNNIDCAIQMLKDDSVVVQFLLGDSVFCLSGLSHFDFAFLDTLDDLDHGLEEFKMCELRGASLVVMDDYETKARKACEYASTSGWKVKRTGRLTIMTR